MSSVLYEKLSMNMPEVFLGKDIDRLSNGIIRWRTIQNMRSAKRIPAECFEKISKRKIVIVRDLFLNWLFSENFQVTNRISKNINVASFG